MTKKIITTEPAQRKYELCLKSHCEAPDFEATITARSKDEAIEKIQNEIDVDADIIRNNLREIKNHV